MKITNKLFKSHCFPAFWCLLWALQFAITVVGCFDNVTFLIFNLISILAFAIWIEDLEAGRHKAFKKTIITILIIFTCFCICMEFMNSNNTSLRVTVYFISSLVINVLYLFATICERIIHIKKDSNI